MTFGQRVADTLELLAQARRHCDPTSEPADPAALRDTLDRLDGELRELQSLCERADITLAVLDIIARADNPEKALVGSLTYLKKRLGVDASGLRLREGGDFPYYTTNGFSSQFVLDESSLRQADHHGVLVRDASGEVILECMCGRVVQGRTDPSRPFFTRRGSFWTNSTSELLETTTDEDRGTHTRNRCWGEGYESVALIPLSSGGEIFGLLQFNDRETGKFTSQTIELLEDLSEYLALLLA